MYNKRLSREVYDKAVRFAIAQHSKPYYHLTPFINHLIGKLGEYAYAEHIGAEINDAIYANHGDGGVDLITRDGEEFNGIQVKTCTWTGPNKQLKIKVSEYEKSKHKIYQYQLMHVDPNGPLYEVSCVGHILTCSQEFQEQYQSALKAKSSLIVFDEAQLTPDTK